MHLIFAGFNTGYKILRITELSDLSVAVLSGRLLLFLCCLLKEEESTVTNGLKTELLGD